jgi:outer membrane protein assembly factor BamB
MTREQAKLLWSYEPVERGAIIATPWVHDSAVYLFTIQDHGVQSLGCVKKLSLLDGKPLWSFDDDSEMRHGISRPVLGNESLFVGEGMHANHFCHLYAIHPETGTKRWKFRAEGHIESSPSVTEASVIFGAGDDGVYCLDQGTGKELWHFLGQVHIDSRPEISGQAVFIGAGVSRAFREPAMLALQKSTGEIIWKIPSDLPVWGSPVARNGVVFFGLGNGRLNRSAEGKETPRGAVIALNVETGKRLWQTDFSDAVMASVAVSNDRVFVGNRDRTLYALDQHDGRIVWTHSMGSPVVNQPAVSGDRVYAVSSEGRVSCLLQKNGERRWSRELSELSGNKVTVFASPVVIESGDQPRRILVGCEVKSGARTAAILYCLEESSER